MRLRRLVAVGALAASLSAIFLLLGAQAAAGGATASRTADGAALPALDLTRTPAGLSTDDALRSVTGRSFFADPWVEAGAATTLRDGLGPLFNARSCTGCHPGGGRSSPVPERTAAWQPTSGLLAKLGAAAGRPDPQYGEQLQTRSVGGSRRAVGGGAGQGIGEGELQVLYRALTRPYADGSAATIQAPTYRVAGLTAGPLARTSTVSARIAPSLDHVSVIEQIDEAVILQRADPDDRDRDGISGRANRVPTNGPGSASTALGRYGHKASQPGLRQQTSAALHHDIGITSSVYPFEDCAPKQASCRVARSGAGPSSRFEIDDQVLDDMVHFLRHLAVPPATTQRAPASPDSRVEQGRRAFAAARCVACHADGAAYKGLYSDLLLHDMGPGLADGRSEHLATGREWRTAPLAGLRLRKLLARVESYLHDGRARSLEEAVLWHDGEARGAQRTFSRMNADERAALLAFLQTL